MVFEAPRTQTEVRSIMFQNGINSSGTSFIFIRTGGPLLTNTVIDSAWSPIAVTGTNRTEPVGELDQKRYVFLSPGDILKASGTCPAPGVTTWAATMVVNVYRWTSVGEFLYTTTSLSWSLGTAATILFTNQTLAAADTAGWYRIVIESISSTTATGAAGDYTMSATITPLATSGWRMVVPADLDANNSGDGTIGESVRVNGVSMLMTNTTALLSRQGNVIAARIPASEDPFLVDVTMLAGRSDRYMGDASKGLYTFKEFTQFSEEFYDCTDNSIKAMSIRLDRPKDWFHVVQISNSQYATAPNTFLTTFSYTYEFKTSNPRYQQDICRHSWESLLAARRIIQNKPDWFYENPSHMAAIYNLIKRGVTGAGRVVKKALPYAAPVASAVAPELLPLIAALNVLLKP
jgi:hypothetical protein